MSSCVSADGTPGTVITAEDLLGVITVALSCRKPQNSVRLLIEGISLLFESDAEDDRRSLPAPELQAMLHPEYRDTAEYHYRMAEHENGSPP